MITKTAADSSHTEDTGLKTVEVRRRWNDWRIAEYRLTDISEMHWDNISGGVAGS
jgi:hypothetical protein